MKKRTVLLVMAACLMLLFSVGVAQGATSSTDTSVTITNTTMTYPRVIHISPDGNDTTGDGTKANPYATYYQAYSVSVADDCIFFEPGTYTLGQDHIYHAQANIVFGSQKLISIIGSGKDTVLEVKANIGSRRDHPIMFLYGKDIANFHLKFTAYNTNTNYSNAIFWWTNARISNIYFEKVGGLSPSYSYYNGGPSGVPNVNNCIFDIGTRLSDYSGSPKYTNCLFSSTPSNGSKVTSTTRSITSTDLDYENLSPDLVGTGTGLNPDGSQANIGVYGGPFAWEDNSLDPDPQEPTNLYADPGDTTIILTWDAVEGATGYNIKRSETQGGPYDTVAENVYGTTYTDTGLTNDVTYYYIVTAVIDSVESAPSNEANATPTAGSTPGGDKSLIITMENGMDKTYRVTNSQLSAFISWFENYSSGSRSYHTFDNPIGANGAKDYLVYSKIVCWRVADV